MILKVENLENHEMDEQKKVPQGDEEWNTLHQKRMSPHSLLCIFVETFELLSVTHMLERTFPSCQRKQVRKFCFCEEGCVQTLLT